MTIEAILLNATWILPILTVLMVIPVSRSNSFLIKMIHAGSALVNVLIAGFLTWKVFAISAAAGIPAGNKPLLNFVTDLPWMQMLNVRFITGVDALSILMILLTSVVVFTGILATWNIDKQDKEFFALAQILSAGVFGVFMAFDLVTFFVFYELEALAMYLMIANWGSGRKDYGGKKLTLYLMLGSAMILVTILGLYFVSGTESFDIRVLADIKFPMDFQMWAFPVMFLGFAVSSSLFPFHNWSPDGHSSAPTAVSMLAAGVMMKMGTYGCLRVAMYLMPEGARFWMPWIVILVAFNVVFAAFIAIRHRDLKYITAYSSIGHLGLIVLGLCAMTYIGIKGAALQMISHGFLTALFFSTIGMIYSRTHTRMIDEMGGIMKTVPFLGVGFVIAGFAGLGLPGLSGFVAEATIFIGSFQNESTLMRLVTVLAILGVTTTAVYVLRAANTMLHGPITNPHFEHLPASTLPEKITVVLLVGCLLGMGLFPGWISSMLDTSLTPISVNVLRGTP
jgi:NADH-quinone oxidoreductase subunit M